MDTYTAEATHDSQFWSIYVPELDRHTQAEKYREIEEAARSLVAILRDVDEDSFTLTVHNRDVDAALNDWHQAEQLDADARKSMTAAANRRREVARTLKAHGLSGEDAAAVLGVSRSRISQLTGANQ
ncbi:helix-turn-helix domain-containing protein [Agrococcus casei]|uniref:Antitoxin HicB n=1 Tax=Agrococcus casei LMG 22410 TaxID=1255656 RepID=A0A1R4FYM8_9MICO|nr:hypothetical protein [Agrococcus casei]SJM61029.1 hypothetical protein CZ674_07460 [Agrococcus casei LMG 22410]